MHIDEIYRCRDCGKEHDSYGHLHHPGLETGGFCASCGSDDVRDVPVAYATGDGKMTELMRNGQCPKCRSNMHGELVCETCGLEIVK